MSQPKLNLPSTPTYYQNPLQSGDLSTLSGLGHQLTSGDFGQGAGGDLSWLQQAVNPNQGYLQSALSSAQGLLQPQFRDTLQQINNNAAANNQLNSSTYTDALARSQSDLNSQYQSLVGQAAMQDSTNAMNNRLSLFGTGLNTLQSALGGEQNDTSSQNGFNQQNYENQVGALLAGRNTSGGLLGGLTGAAGGALAGSSLGPFGAIAGGLAGGLGGALAPQSSNLGGSLLQAGTGLYGSNQLNSTLSGIGKIYGSAAPGSTASNNPFSVSGAAGSQGNNIDQLLALYGGNRN